ncbi:outer membrane beta-barrel protein [Haloferula sp.]|uniref:outer membrane beta-barrel protein n=1 Tax=Haloferula sp. TaxID=2497595 RepID=UPI0032A09474
MSLTSHGQQLVLSDEGRVEARADDRVEGVLEVERIDGSEGGGSGNGAQDDDLKSGGWDFGVAVSAAYDDNIFLSALNPESDLVLQITPRIAYVLGNNEGEEGAYVRFEYRPNGVLYVDNGDENRVDHDVALSAGVQGEKASVAFAGVYRKLGDAIADTGTQTDRQEYAVEIRAAYSISEKVALEAAVGADGTDYDVAALSSSSNQFAEVAIRYAYSPKTQVTLAYRAGRAEVDGTGDQTFHRMTARMAWKPRQKISIDLEAGFEHRDFDRGSDNYPVVELRVGWEVREGTELYLTGYRREEVSAFFTGQNYSLTGFTAGVSQRFSDAWTGRLEGGYEKASYSRVSGVGPAGREDEIYFIRPSVEYAVNDRFNTTFYYQYSKDKSNQGAFGYSNHQVGVSAAYDF